jgi:hypothetical protein
MTRVLSKIRWQMTKNGPILVESKRAGYIVIDWSGNIRTNITLKTLANHAVKGKKMTIMLTKEEHDGKYILGPIVDVFDILENQGVIIAPEPYVYMQEG